MNKIIIFVCLGLTLVQASGNRPDWYPENSNEIRTKCREQHPMTPDFDQQLIDRHLTDSEGFRAMLMCSLTNLRVFIPGKGFDVERLAFEMYYRSGKKCNRELVRECVDKNKEKQPEGAMVFNVIKCILEVELMTEDVDDDTAGVCDLKQ